MPALSQAQRSKTGGGWLVFSPLSELMIREGYAFSLSRKAFFRPAHALFCTLMALYMWYLVY